MRLIDLIRQLGECPQGQADAWALRSMGGRSLSFGELSLELRAVSDGLIAAGLKPGDRALFALRPSPEAVVLYLAVLRIGGSLVATNLGIGENSFAARVAALAPRFVLSEPVLLAASRSSLLRWGLRRFGIGIPRLAEIPDATFVTVGPWAPGAPAALTFDSLRAAIPHTQEPQVTRDHEHEAFIVFTSGTTADPKGVLHTQGSLGAMLELVRPHLKAGPGDVVFARDLHLVVPSLLSGASVLLPDYGPFDAARTLDALETHGVTHAFGVPHDWQLLIERCRRTGRRLPASLKLVMLGAAPVRAPFLERLSEVLGPRTRVECVYGMTEMLPVASISLEEKLAYTGTGDPIGRLFPGVNARANDDGELLVSGPGLFRGYLGQTEVAEHATGDLAQVDENGQWALLGRRKDMLIRGHHNIYPELYEPALEAIPGVRRCAIVGVYDESIADERVVIAVEPDEGVDGALFERRFRREVKDGVHRIDMGAQPDAVIFGPLPVCGRSNKVDKRALRAIAIQRLGLTPALENASR